METPPLPNLTPSKDEEHLRLLSIFHYIVGALMALFACFPLLHVGFGIMVLMNPDAFGKDQHGEHPPAWFGYLFLGLGLFMFLVGWAAAICTLLSGRYLAKRKKRMFSFVIGAILCLFMPLGTVLGIFTLIVLSRESVQRLYERNGF